MRDPALILIADDNDDNRAILEARLANQGYALLTARDGEEALALATSEKPDAILLDVMMPKLDGFDVCRRIKADATLPFMPIVLVTAKATTADVIEGFNAGADDYLTKPVDQAALVARLRSILRIKSLQDTVTEQAAQLANGTRICRSAWKHRSARSSACSGCGDFCLHKSQIWFCPQATKCYLKPIGGMSPSSSAICVDLRHLPRPPNRKR